MPLSVCIFVPFSQQIGVNLVYSVSQNKAAGFEDLSPSGCRFHRFYFSNAQGFDSCFQLVIFEYPVLFLRSRTQKRMMHQSPSALIRYFIIITKVMIIFTVNPIFII